MAELRKYGVQATFYFPLIDRGQADFEATPVTHVANDTYVDKDGAGFNATTNAFAHRGNGIYSIVLTAAEMQAANIVVTIIDQGAKAWEDQAVLISTYGHPSAAHAFDLDSPTVSAGSPYGWYVTKAGNDANDGLSWPQAKLTIAATVAAAAADGDTIHIGPGTFPELVDASAKALHFLGSGPGTILTHNADHTIVLGANSSIRQLQIVNTLAPCPPNAYALDMDAAHNVLIEDVVFTSVDYGIRATNCNGLHVRRCTFYCPEYAVYTWAASPAGRTIVEDCICYATGWTNCNAGCMMFSGPALLRNCVIAVESDNADPAFAAIPVTIYNASHVLIDNCVLEAIGTDVASAWGVYLQSANAGDVVTILNSTIVTSSVAGDAYDLYNADVDGTLAVGMTRYDKTKTSGTITIVSPSVSLTAEDTRISIE